MNRLSIFTMIPLLFATACSASDESETGTPSAELPAPDTEVQAEVPASSISVQEMLVSGPTQLKLHSLAMITQGNVQGAVDDSYLPGLTICAEDPALPLRSVSAQILGQYFVQDQAEPNPEALALLIKLAKDESPYVRYNAVYYGLSQIKNKSDEVIDLLLNVAATDREQGLFDRISDALKPDRERVVALLDKKLEEGDNVAVFEVYEDLTGKKPAQADKYMEKPSSLPRLFIFKVSGSDEEAFKAELMTALKAAGIENPNLALSGKNESTVVLLRTYITKDRLAVEQAFSDHPEFKITQTLWLTPQLDSQLQKMK